MEWKKKVERAYLYTQDKILMIQNYRNGLRSKFLCSTYVYSTCSEHGNRTIITILIVVLLVYCVRAVSVSVSNFDLWTIEKRIKYTKLIINYEKKAGSFRSNRSIEIWGFNFLKSFDYHSTFRSIFVLWIPLLGSGFDEIFVLVCFYFHFLSCFFN